ncbi:MAG: 4Fe-4S binding protein [Firmicutes bacterium]|nr:4Fe-4S binding protein [Bacillota bacterium]
MPPALKPAVHGKSAVGGYSGNAVKPIALRFIHELACDEKLKDMHLSGVGGIETWQDALEFMALGAESLQVTTAVMKYGYRIIKELKAGLNNYLAEKGYDSVKEIAGIGKDSVSDTTDILERDTRILPKFNRKKCIGCGRCAVSCADGSHQAITFTEDRKPMLKANRCVGCHLCILVCPARTISPGSRMIAAHKNNRDNKKTLSH